MYWTNDILVQFSVVGDQTNTFAITKKPGEHHSVGSSHGTIIPDVMYLESSALAGSWNWSGMGRGAEMRYGTQLSFR